MLCLIGHALTENRSGLIAQANLSRADDHVERRAAFDIVHAHPPGSTRKLTLGVDGGYEASSFLRDLRQACVTPHVARQSRHSVIDGRMTLNATTPSPMKHCKRIKEPFGRGKTAGSLA